MKTKSTRIGKKDIFAGTAGPAPAGPGLSTAPGLVAGESRAAEDKLTVILPPDQVAFLDRLALDIRSKTGWKVRRTEIIRGLVRALMLTGIDLTSSRSEKDIAATVAGLKD